MRFLPLHFANCFGPSTFRVLHSFFVVHSSTICGVFVVFHSLSFHSMIYLKITGSPSFIFRYGLILFFNVSHAHILQIMFNVIIFAKFSNLFTLSTNLQQHQCMISFGQNFLAICLWNLIAFICNIFVYFSSFLFSQWFAT